MITMSIAMSGSVPLRVDRWIIATLLVLLSGCSALRLTYGQGPLLAYWWMDRYLDFTSEQAPLVRGALADWFAWHRQTQLPDYAAWLRELQPIARDSVTPETVCQVGEAAQRRLEAAYEQAVPMMAPIVRTLTSAQVDHLGQRYARNNKEAERDFLQPDPQDRAEASLKRTVERAEQVYGSLDESQRQLVAAGLATAPFDPQRWLVERRARQQDILRTLRQLLATQADAAAVQAALRGFAADAVRSPRADYRAYRERVDQANCALAARLHNALRPAQRQHAVDKLKGWEEDLRALAAAARPTAASPTAAP
jgi:hypothetical protein